MVDPDIGGKLLLKALVEAPCCEPAIERGVHHVLQLQRVDLLARRRHWRDTREKTARLQRLPRKLFDKLADLLAQRFRLLKAHGFAPQASYQRI